LAVRIRRIEAAVQYEYKPQSDEHIEQVMRNLDATSDATLIYMTLTLNRLAFNRAFGWVKETLDSALLSQYAAFERFAPAALAAAEEIHDGEHEPVWPNLPKRGGDDA